MWLSNLFGKSKRDEAIKRMGSRLVALNSENEALKATVGEVRSENLAMFELVSELQTTLKQTRGILFELKKATVGKKSPQQAIEEIQIESASKREVASVCLDTLLTAHEFIVKHKLNKRYSSRLARIAAEFCKTNNMPLTTAPKRVTYTFNEVILRHAWVVIAESSSELLVVPSGFSKLSEHDAELSMLLTSLDIR